MVLTAVQPFRTKELETPLQFWAQYRSISGAAVCQKNKAGKWQIKISVSSYIARPFRGLTVGRRLRAALRNASPSQQPPKGHID